MFTVFFFFWLSSVLQIGRGKAPPICKRENKTKKIPLNKAKKNYPETKQKKNYLNYLFRSLLFCRSLFHCFLLNEGLFYGFSHGFRELFCRKFDDKKEFRFLTRYISSSVNPFWYKYPRLTAESVFPCSTANL